MDGHTKHAIKKVNIIKKSALDLFNKYGVNKVSIDEIADYANVSKVTIYKYFKSKDGLYKEIVKMLFDENIDALQNLINNDIPFLEKLKFLITTKTSSQQYMKGTFVYELIKEDYEIEEYLKNNYLSRVKELIFSFIEQGKKEGYIDRSLSNEIIYLYMEILKAGLREKSSDMKPIITNKDTFENLINLYFYGLIKKLG
jgi:AcrR family transcriptional regulator